MAVRTYYHVLGVSRNATLEEITSAKNALAKVYHPDANIKDGIDTTAYMQEILEAYRVLSNPEKRSKYDRKLSGGSNRVFRTFTMGEPEAVPDEASFVSYWAAAGKLNELVSKSVRLLEKEEKKRSLSQRLLKKLGKEVKPGKELTAYLDKLALQALGYITTLKNAEIPMDYWNGDAMNWILVHWSQNQHLDYRTLFAQYDAYINQNTSAAERLKLRNANRQFHHNLKVLLTYAL